MDFYSFWPGYLTNGYKFYFVRYKLHFFLKQSHFRVAFKMPKRRLEVKVFLKSRLKIAHFFYNFGLKWKTSKNWQNWRGLLKNSDLRLKRSWPSYCDFWKYEAQRLKNRVSYKKNVYPMNFSHLNSFRIQSSRKPSKISLLYISKSLIIKYICKF